MFWIYQFSLNNDLSLVDYKSFLGNEDGVFPVTSLCFGDPLSEEKLSQYGLNVKKHEYTEFLLGKSYDNILTTVDYENVSLQLMDFVTKFRVHNTNGSKHNPSDGIGVKSIESYSAEKGWGFAKCFALEINDANVYKIAIDMKSDIFPNGLRPPSDEFHILFHYPKQISLSSRNFKSSWPTRNDNQSYHMHFKIRNVETLKRRYKDGHKCIQDWKKFDDIIADQRLTSNGCKTPFQESNKDLPICNNSEQMRQAVSVTSMNKKLVHGHLPPCQTMESIDYEYREKDVNGNGMCQIRIEFSNRNFKQITQTREISLMSLIGNVGGFIGICIGYSFLDFFDFITSSFRHIKNGFFKTRIRAQERTQTGGQETKEKRVKPCDDEWRKEGKEQISRIHLRLNNIEISLAD